MRLMLIVFAGIISAFGIFAAYGTYVNYQTTLIPCGCLTIGIGLFIWERMLFQQEVNKEIAGLKERLESRGAKFKIG